MDYQNVPRTIGAVMSHKMATLYEMQTVYSLGDVYAMIEVLNVDAHNQKILNKAQD